MNVYQKWMTAFSLALVLTACPSPPSISSFTATPSSLPAGGGNVTLAWNVSGATLLAIDQGVGVVGGTSTTVTVTASKIFTLTASNSNGATTATTSVTVSPAPSIASLTISPAATVALGLGATQAFSAVAKDVAGNVLTTPALTWASSDTTVASVDGNGLASAVASGVSSVTAKAGGVTSNAVSLVVRPSGILAYSLFNSATSAYQVHQVRLDGTQDVKIVDGWNPHFSPDGKFVAYQRDGAHPSGRGDSLCVFDLGASSEKKAVNDSTNEFIVSSGWTPDSQNVVYDINCSINEEKRDGSSGATVRNSGNCYDDAPNANLTDGKIAFHNTTTGGLWVMNADRSGATTISNTQIDDALPAWSPDGQWISFIRCDKTDIKGVLYKVHPDGSGLTRLTLISFDANTNYVKPTFGWTPDGKFVVAAMVKGGVSSVQMVDAGGSGVMAPVSVANPDKVDFVGNVVTSTP